MFLVKKLLSLALLPPLAPLLVTAAGLLLQKWRPRSGRWLAWGGLALAVLIATPAVVDRLLAGLEDIPPIDPAALREAQAIVILAGGARTNAPEFNGQTVSRLSLERARYGARLARQSGLPVLVSGGAPAGSAPEAELLRAALEEDFGVPVRWVESRSLDTRDNARLSAAILREAGIGKVALVTHAAHMHRSVEAFEAAGLSAIPAPTAYLGHSGNDEAITRVPNMNTAYAGFYALHEWLGLWAYRLSR